MYLNTNYNQITEFNATNKSKFDWNRSKNKKNYIIDIHTYACMPMGSFANDWSNWNIAKRLDKRDTRFELYPYRILELSRLSKWAIYVYIRIVRFDLALNMK